MKEDDASTLVVYDFDSIRLATDNFDAKNKLGQGGFGPVYKVKDKPFKVLVRYKVLREGTKADVKNSREVSQYIRVQLHNWKLESNQILLNLPPSS